MFKHKPIAVVGAGFSGSVIARELAEAGKNVEVFDTRSHVAGNCHTERDPLTGILLHKYGAHIFHTSNKKVWDYINLFGDFAPFTNRVKAVSCGGVYSLPVNLHTINQLFGRTFSPSEAQAHLESISLRTPSDPQNFEEQALHFLGSKIYEMFFEGYTRKQWGMEPRLLPASILKRLPVRFNYDDNYYNSTFQGMPKDGYTAIVKNILDHKSITLLLSTPFRREQSQEFEHVFYSGPIDAWFGYTAGRLGYRTLDFVREDYDGDFQGNAVVNYCDLSVPWTRIVEHKHFAPWEQHSKSVIFKEFSRDCEADDTPYYPIRLVAERALLSEYVRMANTSTENVTFVGRLGTYRYLDMHVTIEEALECAHKYTTWAGAAQFPKFNVNPL